MRHERILMFEMCAIQIKLLLLLLLLLLRRTGIGEGRQEETRRRTEGMSAHHPPRDVRHPGAAGPSAST